MKKPRFCTLGLSPAGPVSAARQRLTQAFLRLQYIEFTRNQRQDAAFGKSDEERIVWRELLDLELQEIDEQIEGISAQ